MKITTKTLHLLLFLTISPWFSLLFGQQKTAASDSDNLAKAWFDEALYEPDNASKIAAYNNVLKLNPNMADAYNNRGVAKKHLGRFSEAIADYDQAIALKPDFAVAYYNRGDAKKNLSQYEEALKDFNKAIELRPDLPQPYGSKGCTLVALGRYKEALAPLNKCLEMDDKQVFAKNCRKEAINARKK